MRSHGAPTDRKLSNFISTSLQPHLWAHIKRWAEIMKRRVAQSIFAVALLTAVGVLAVLIYRYADPPILKSALQGGDIVAVIEREFKIPSDPLMKRPGIFCDNWLYWRGFDWNAGSLISICGVHDTSTQDRIIGRIEGEVEKNGLCDIQVVFYGDTKIEEEDRFTRRIEGPELRKVRIFGVTKSWRKLLAAHEQEAQGIPPNDR